MLTQLAWRREGHWEAATTHLAFTRVHGVSGATPENLLDHPHAARVDGNGEAGFFRRWWEAPPTDNDTSEEQLEAYSWGGLAAGSWQRALWLLLTPFMLRVRKHTVATYLQAEHTPNDPAPLDRSSSSTGRRPP